MIEFSPGEIRAYWTSHAKLHQVGGELRGPCPVHGGKRDSFAVNLETGQACCHSECGGQGWDIPAFEQQISGCDFTAALSNIGAIIGRTLSNGNGNGHSQPRQQPARGKKLASEVRAWLATDGFRPVREFSHGGDLRTVRFEHTTKIQPDKGRPEKTFRWEHRIGDVWYSGDGGLEKPVYMNQIFQDRDQAGLVIGFEGEAKADLAGELGFAGFSFKDISEQAAGALVDCDVVLWGDADPAGANNVKRAAAVIAKTGARSVAIAAPPPDLPGGGDIVDAVRRLGWTAEHISRLIASARPIEIKSQAPRVMSVADILKLDIPEALMLIEGNVPANGASLVVGTAKSGKTLTAAQMGISVASGAALYGFYRVLNPGPVLFVEQDDPAGAGSIKTILQRSSVPVAGIPFHLVAGVPYQFGPEFLEWLEGQIVKLAIRLAVLDSYTALRGPRPKGVDIVKAEQGDLTQLDALAKRTNSALLIIHHSSKGSAGLDWSERAAGTFAMSAATESQIHISRFPELDGAPERLVRVRGRHSEDLELVLRFRKETLDFEHVLEGGAATLYPALLQLQVAFGQQAFSPKDLAHATGLSIATAHRQITRLYRANALQKRGYGEYALVAR